MNLKVSDTKREDGFTLIELLVVVIIIGILAAIAIPLFLNQRERAWIGTTESDVRNAAIEVETQATREGEYPDVGDLNEPSISANVSLYYDTINVGDGTDNGFQICGTHEQLEGAVTYDSSLGGLTEEFEETAGAQTDCEALGAWDDNVTP